MAKKQSSLIFLAISLILVCFAVSNFLGIKKVKGEGVVSNVFGWAWSSNIGWISFNSGTDGSIIDYGVHINDEGIFSGYAWSENIGWIHFAPTSGYPKDPQNGVIVDLKSGEVSGWARALSFGGGWDGWINLRPGVDYGVLIDNTGNCGGPGDFSGWAWGSDVIGWISFSGTNYNASTSFALNQKPKAENLNTVIDNCAWGQLNQISPNSGMTVILKWEYSDPEGDSQKAYQIQFGDDELDSIISSAAAYTLQQEDILFEWNKTYKWRVKVMDACENWSDWSAESEFTTPQNAYPYPDFDCNSLDCSKVRPAEDEAVTLTNKSVCYGSPACEWTACEWTVESEEIISEYHNSCDELEVAFKKGENKVKLEVTDSNGYTCSTEEKTINALWPLPEWREISPF